LEKAWKEGDASQIHQAELLRQNNRANLLHSDVTQIDSEKAGKPK